MPPGKGILAARHAAEWFGLRLAVGLSAHLPRRLLGSLAKAFGTFVHRCDRSGRAVAMENIRCALPDVGMTERSRIARESYQNLARTFLDLFWAKNLNPENCGDHVTMVEDEQGLLETYGGTGSIWVTPHYGNFEWAAVTMGLWNARHSIIAQEFRNPRLTPLFKTLREVSGHRIIPQERSMIRLFKELKNGRSVAFLTDLNAPLSQSPSIIDCFGLKTCVTSLHGVLARRCGVPVLPALCTPTENDRYEMRFFSPLQLEANTQVWTIAQRCWDVFEPIVKERPEHWIWMYKHWRYLPDGVDPDTYPSYANPKRKFDRILREQSS